MVTATVPTRAESSCIAGQAEKVAAMTGVSAVFSIAGCSDLVPTVCIAWNEKPADVISRRMRRLQGIAETETMIAFRAHSRQEPEAEFEPGRD